MHGASDYFKKYLDISRDCCPLKNPIEWPHIFSKGTYLAKHRTILFCFSLMYRYNELQCINIYLPI